MAVNRAFFDSDWSFIDGVRTVTFRLFIPSSEALDDPISCDAFPAGGENKNVLQTGDNSVTTQQERVWHLRASHLDSISSEVTQNSQIIDTDGRVYLIGPDIRYQTYRSRIRCVCKIIG